MPRPPSVRSAAFLLTTAASVICVAPALAQTTVAGARFQDLGAAVGPNALRTINLGNARGSIAVIDFDRDGFYDLFLNDDAGRSKRLYRNVADTSVPGGRGFRDVSVAAGIASDANATARQPGAVVIFDYNNDGFDDIYTTGYSIAPNPVTPAGLLFRNNGDGTFTNVSAAARIASPAGITPDTAAAIDLNHDGYLDLLLDNVGSASQTFTLLLNNGDGTFTNRSDLVTQPGFSGRIYASAFTDIDHDGWADHVALLNNGVGLVLKNVPGADGTRRLTSLTSLQSGMNFVGPAPMGIAVGDYDGDGWLDLAITDASTGTYYRNNRGVFSRVSPYTTFFGWGTTWLDTTNKGRLDNYQAGSFSNANIDHLRINNGPDASGQITWTDARAALNTPALASQHTVRVDFDNDGLEDLVTNNPTRFVSVYRNSASTANHWSKIKLEGTVIAGSTPRVNRDAIGAVVRVTAGGVTQVRELLAGSSFGSTEDPRLHFGLGNAVTIDRVEVIWPRAGTLASRTQVFTGPFDADRIISLSSERTCLLDFDQDGLLTNADLAAFLAAFLDESTPTGPSGTSAVPCLDAPAPYTTLGFAADYNRDCAVNQEDLSAFITDFFLEIASPSNCTTVPASNQ